MGGKPIGAIRATVLGAAETIAPAIVRDLSGSPEVAEMTHVHWAGGARLQLHVRVAG